MDSTHVQEPCKRWDRFGESAGLTPAQCLTELPIFRKACQNRAGME